MRERVVYQYSSAFRQEVLSALESGRFASAAAARRHYGIRSSATIGNWVKRMGRRDLQVKVVRVEKPNEADRVRELQKQVAQLQGALGQTQAQNLLHEELLKRACGLLGQDLESFKKKNVGAPSTGSLEKDGSASP